MASRGLADAAAGAGDEAIDLRPEKLIPMGDGRVLFSSFTQTSGEELWVSDGTARGTRQVVDLEPGFGGGAPRSLQPLGDGRFVFTSFVNDTREQLFVTDGRTVTSLGDLRPGFLDADPALLTPLGNGLMLFTADDGVTRREPWVTDGTPDGTRRLANLNIDDDYALPPPSPDFNRGDAQIDGFTVVREKLAVFVAIHRRASATGEEKISRELYATDGTPEGTRVLAPVAPFATELDQGYNAATDTPRNLTPLPDGRLIYEAYDAALSRLGYWLSDGTPEGTRALGIFAGGGPLTRSGTTRCSTSTARPRSASGARRMSST
jgi:ELWxxDGT repeat protein